jgi:glycosyltransferase involved in cell wall biosynthesis
MLTVIIPTMNSERALVPTLAMLVPGAINATVRDVIIADGGSTDATAEVADLAGCALMASHAPLAARLRSAAAAARAPWLMFLRAGTVLEASWLEETTRTIEDAVARGAGASHAAVFRRAPRTRSPFGQIVALAESALRAPHPDQGLIISRLRYDALGGHRDCDDPESDLLRRLGRIVTLDSAATGPRPQIVDKVK